MTREEAIKTFEDILQLSPTLDETGCSVTEAMKVVLSALRPANDPLSLEQLREMNGEPVYLIVKDGYEPLGMWALIDVSEKDHIVLINNIGGRSSYYSDDDLERDHITVYRRPPEGEEGDADRG